MQENITAMLVENRPGTLGALRLGLEKQSITISTARSCGEAALALWSEHPPHLVFTEVDLADGNWANIVALAARAGAPVNVIVVARFVDVGFYVHAIERGAFDFIVPPLSESDFLHVARTAAANVVRQRIEHAPPLPTADRAAEPKRHQPGHAAAGAQN
jgi:DNA-binding NtrC family response regulator